MRNNPNRYINIFEKVRFVFRGMASKGCVCVCVYGPFPPPPPPNSNQPHSPNSNQPHPPTPNTHTPAKQDLYNPARIYAQSFSEKGASPKLTQLLGAITTVEDCINRIERVAKGTYVGSWGGGGLGGVNSIRLVGRSSFWMVSNIV